MMGNCLLGSKVSLGVWPVCSNGHCPIMKSGSLGLLYFFACSLFSLLLLHPSTWTYSLACEQHSLKKLGVIASTFGGETGLRDTTLQCPYQHPRKGM